MISDYVMNENHCRGTEKANDAIGLAAYNMDSHNIQRMARNGRAENEGDGVLDALPTRCPIGPSCRSAGSGEPARPGFVFPRRTLRMVPFAWNRSS